MNEQAFTFPCGGDRLVGVIHHPPSEPAPIGLIIVVGGPQYRVGAHRQYVHLARAAALAGVAVMRFDYRGVGDSEGAYPGFEAVGPDIDAAIASFRERVPALGGVALWGLCEGASAILLAGVKNPFVQGAILVNPWVRTESGEAQTYLKHYYGKRLFSTEAWKRIFKGDVNLISALSSVIGLIRRALPGRGATTEVSAAPYPERMGLGLADFRGQTLLLMSERDLVAREFDDVTASAATWRGLLTRPSVRRVDLPDTDHTFSSAPWRAAAATATIDFLKNLATGNERASARRVG